MIYKINHANIKDWAANYDGPLFDGILCDPPYELGFMGKSWDSTGIAFDTEMWADIYKLLKPGAHLLAFSGSRTYHRMACAIEDAGFEIRDMIEWVYGSGFPKSFNVSKAIEGKLTIGSLSWNDWHKLNGELSEAKAQGSNGLVKLNANQGNKPTQYASHGSLKLEPTTEQAKLWEGYGTALKPAHEPCVLARKPLDGTVANNVLKHGTGGLNIDGTRVGNEIIPSQKSGSSSRAFQSAEPTTAGGMSGGSTGRFPANLIHDGSDEVLEVFPDTKSGKMGPQHTRHTNGSPNGIYGKFDVNHELGETYGDSGSAARFFYTAKASKSERNAGLDGFEPKREADRIKDDGVGGDNLRNRTNKTKVNHHPTVKPLALTKYLATLIKPPKGGRLLVPFSGSGSEMIGALQAGWEYVEGVELTEEYIPIAEARIKYWLQKRDKQGKLL